MIGKTMKKPISLKLITLLSLPAIVLLTFFVASNLTNNANADNTLSTHTICSQIKKGNYDNIEALLKSDTTLKQVSLNNKGEPLYTKLQVIELTTIITKCALGL